MPYKRTIPTVCQCCGCSFLADQRKRRFCSQACYHWRPPLPANAPLRLCACGCGRHVRLPNHNWLHGHARTRRYPSFDEHLVEAANGCLECRGWRDEDGYVRFEENGVRHLAHRYAWERANGPIPEGMCVCHTCDNPPCCRLEHLWLGTNVDNMADKARKKRSNIGEGNPGHKITEAIVRAIRARYKPRVVTSVQLGREYRIDPKTVRCIAHRKTWKYVA